MLERDSMAESMQEQLDKICRSVEENFPNVICAHEGFAHPRMPSEDEEAIVEVLFAPPGSSRQIMRFTYAERKRLAREQGISVAMCVYYEDETLQYCLDDVLAIQSARTQANLVDPGAFTAETEATRPLPPDTIVRSWQYTNEARSRPMDPQTVLVPYDAELGEARDDNYAPASTAPSLVCAF